MTKISLIAKVVAAEGQSDNLVAALTNLMEAAATEEGLEVYAANQDPNDPNVFYFFEVYTDSDALKVHGKGDEMRAAMKQLGSLLAGAPEVTVLTPVAAKGVSI